MWLEVVEEMMRERLEAAINVIRADGRIPSMDEKSIRADVIDPILERLGWDRFSEDFVPEFPVGNRSVDYALRARKEPKVFIEAKNPREDLRRHEDQLLEYCGRHAVQLAALTKGLTWWLYLPLKEGGPEARRFSELDISNQDVSETCDHLIEFLSYENVCSGAAVENAKIALIRLENDKKVKEALPRAWEELTAGPDGLLVDLINDKVKGLCGVEAGPERIKGFLVGLGETESKGKDSLQDDEDNPVTGGKRSYQRKYGGKRIKSFTVFGDQFYPRSWKEMVAEVANQVYLKNPSQFHRQAPDLRGRTREYFSRDPERLEQPQGVGDSGWFVYTKWDPDRTVAVCRNLLELFGYDQDDLRVETCQ